MRKSNSGLGSRRTRRAGQVAEDEEAIEEGPDYQDHVPEIVEEGEGEDLMANEEEDYRAIEKLDHYDEADMDDEHYERIEPEAKRQADLEIARRERERRRGDEGPFARKLHSLAREESEGSSIFDGHDYSAEMRQRRERKFNELGEDELDEDESKFDNEKFSNLNQIRGKLPAWIGEKSTVQYIVHTFKKFLLEFKDERRVKVYEQRIHEMCSNNRMSLDVTFTHLTKECPTLAFWVFEAPGLILKHLNEVVYRLACKYYAGYQLIQQEVFVKIVDFPLKEELRELRTEHLNTLIKIEGVVTKRHPVCSQLKQVYYICKCGDRKGPLFVSEGVTMNIGSCPRCHAKPPFHIDQEETKYRNFQRLTVQESPSSVPPGRVPRHKDVVVLGDNIDVARPGDEVEITGVYASIFDYGMNIKHGFPVFSTSIEANTIRLKHEKELEGIDEADRAEFHALAKNPRVFELLTGSIAPSIFGHRTIKKALLLSLLGGTQTQRENHRIRGDINVLMIGDPGLAKSQFLKYIQTVAQRSVYTTGKGASAVGLTASVRKDPATGEWALEGGAMVLADTGVCLIDEFDKMNDQDRTSIHEAMEQQSISVSKAGIVANLQARCSVIAAANPTHGKYDSQLSFMDNVGLSEPIISRFDILCILKDEVDFAEDSRMASFIVRSHKKSTPESLLREKAKEEPKPEGPAPEGQVSQKFLKKYIAYARKTCRPELGDDVKSRLTQFYSRLRAVSASISGLNIVVRHFESLIRFAQASAKLHLRNRVNDHDVDIAIETLLESFIQTQKPISQKDLRIKFSEELKKNRDTLPLIANILNELVKENIIIQRTLKDPDEKIVVRIPLKKFQMRVSEAGLRDIREFLASPVFHANYILKDDLIIKEF